MFEQLLFLFFSFFYRNNKMCRNMMVPKTSGCASHVTQSTYIVWVVVHVIVCVHVLNYVLC